jgi:hypothetical protein
VLGSAASIAALTQLRLTDCDLLDELSSGALAALSVLPFGLQHLSIRRIFHKGCSVRAPFPAGVLPRLQQLTYLELAGMHLLDPPMAKALGLPPVFFFGTEGEGQEGEGEAGEGEGEEVGALQPLQALTRLVELRLDVLQYDRGEDSSHCRITSSILPSSRQLKRLVLSGRVQLEPDALAGRTQLQLLDLDLTHTIFGAAAEAAQLLSHIQPMQELTHLHLGNLWAVREGSPPAAAYSALIASSKLQYLDISECRLPEGVLPHLFPAGRQLPNLQSLNIAHVREHSEPATIPEGSRLVSCCPRLQSLHLGGVQGLNAVWLAPLQGLSGLHMLRFAGPCLTSDGWQALCQLTGLRELDMCYLPPATREQLLQATQLQQLTRFVFRGFMDQFDCSGRFQGDGTA